MITREEAIERALNYLTGDLRQRLRAFEGWPGEAERYEFAGVPRPQQIPDSLRNAAAPKRPEADEGEAHCEVEGIPQRVWRVHVPGDGGHVGADHFVIVDAETGRVFTEMRCGE